MIDWRMIYTWNGESLYTGKYKGFEIIKKQVVTNTAKEYTSNRTYKLVAFDKDYNKLKDLKEDVDFLCKQWEYRQNGFVCVEYDKEGKYE